jgi:hypothetical protein
MSLHDRAVRDAVEQHLANLRSVDANALQSVLVKFDTNGAKHAMIVDQVHKVRTNFDVNSTKNKETNQYKWRGKKLRIDVNGDICVC